MNFIKLFIWMFFINYQSEGIIVKPGDFPFLVYLLGKKRCSGTLFTLRRFITAAHCFVDGKKTLKAKDFKVVGGVVDISDTKGKTKTLSSIVIHEGYSKKKHHRFGYNDDIGMGELSAPFETSATLSPARIVSDDESVFKNKWKLWIKSGDPCLSLGWPSKRHKSSPNILKAYEILPLDDLTCEQDTHDYKEGEICAYPVDTNENEFITNIDSGGTLMCGKFAFGLSRIQLGDNISQILGGLLFYPYIDYFDLEVAANSENNLNSLFLIYFITVMINKMS